MPRRKHRIISKAVVEDAAKKRTEVAIQPSSCVLYIPNPKTRADEIYNLIEDACRLCFEDEDGVPWIRREDVEDKGEGIYVVRFRCPLDALLLTRISLNKVVEKVCRELKSEIRYFCGDREVQYVDGIRQRYYDCAWVICEGELLSKEEEEEDWEDNDCESCIDSQEEIEGELTDESTAEEVEERIEESLENFV